MNTHPKSPKTNAPKPKTSATTLTLQPPKLLLPTILSFLTTGILYFIIYQDLSYQLPFLLREILYVITLPLTAALGLFLLHRLLEVIIIHRTFHPAHLFSIIAIILSVAVFYLTDAMYFWIILYVLAGIIFAASLSFQKSHSLTADPAHFLSSLISTAVAVIILSLLNLFVLLVIAIDNEALPELLFSASVITILPLQLALTFLTLTKLTPARSANLLPRFDFFIIIASLLFSLLSFASYAAYTEHELADTRISCCQSTL